MQLNEFQEIYSSVIMIFNFYFIELLNFKELLIKFEKKKKY